MSPPNRDRSTTRAEIATTPSRLYDGTPFEESAGYARAARHGRYIAVSGTVAMETDGHVAHPDDLYQQTKQAFLKGIDAVEKLGGNLNNVIRTRMFLVAGTDWKAAATAHGEIFSGVDPANTSLYISGLFVPGALIEVEIDAILGDADPRTGNEPDPLRALTVEILNEHETVAGRGREDTPGQRSVEKIADR